MYLYQRGRCISTELRPDERENKTWKSRRIECSDNKIVCSNLEVKEKRAKYSDTPAPYSLVPFILEANGAFSNEAKNLLKTIVKRTVHIKGRGQFSNAAQRVAYLLNELTTDISVALQKASADNIWNCSAHAVRCNLRNTSIGLI